MQMYEDKCDVVFCVLAYKNSMDLQEFIASVYKECRFKYRIIVVNSYFDDETLNAIKVVADNYKCDFLNVPNNGYGAGNNKGIEFAIKKYGFSFLVVCNPDTIVKNFDMNSVIEYKTEEVILAPNVVCASGKRQNPAIGKYSAKALKLICSGYKKDKKLTLYRGLAINKINRLLFLLKKKNSGKRIFQAHGSFVIFSRSALEKLMPVYDENIFLFCEEMDLAFKARANNVETIYIPEIDIYHKEDGSMKLTNLNIYNEEKKSCLYCSQKWGINK